MNFQCRSLIIGLITPSQTDDINSACKSCFVNEFDCFSLYTVEVTRGNLWTTVFTKICNLQKKIVAYIHLSFCFYNSALTEKIVSVLPKMKCPHRLEPHQIQGLDFIHIFPVVQVIISWCIDSLLKKAIKLA